MKSFMQNRDIRLVLTGGGSGGHMFPLVAILRELKELAKKNQINLIVRYIGPKDFTSKYIAIEGLTVKNILSGKFRRSINPRDLLLNFIDIFRVIAGCFQCLWEMLVFMPDAILSKGGYGSVPIMLSGTLYFIPKFIHESDSIPGLSNTIFASAASRIFVAFQKSVDYFPARKTKVVGNPIRDGILNGADPARAKQNLNLAKNRPILAVIGGSQGAKSINDILLDILPDLVEKIEVIHQTGIYNYEEVAGETKIIFQEIVKDKDLQKYYHPVAFLEENAIDSIKSLQNVLWAADLIVSRAGSGSIFEIAALAKPSILIPLPWASRDHQTQNAYEYAEDGAAEVVESSNLTPNVFADLILGLIFDKQKLQAMSQKALAFAKPDAAKVVALDILNAILMSKGYRINP